MSPSRPLRDAAVEAVAAEILRWGIKPEKLPAGEKHLAGLALDAFLDALETTDDIPLYPSETGYRDVVYTTADGVTAAYLIAVLREGDEQ